MLSAPVHPIANGREPTLLLVCQGFLFLDCRIRLLNILSPPPQTITQPTTDRVYVTTTSRTTRPYTGDPSLLLVAD